MTIDDLLKEAEKLGFVEQVDRHNIREVYREACRVYRQEHREHKPATTRTERVAYEDNVCMFAEAVTREYVRKEIDKWQKRGYKHNREEKTA